MNPPGPTQTLSPARQRNSKPPKHLLRQLVTLLVYVAVLALSYFGAYVLRSHEIPPERLPTFWQTLPWVLIVKVVMFLWIGNFLGWWRYVTFHDLASIFQASCGAFAVIFAASFLSPSWLRVPSDIAGADALVTIFLLGGLRGSYRYLRERIRPMLVENDVPRTLFIGANESGAAISGRIHTDTRLPFHIVGMLDWNPANWHTTLGGTKVLGGLDDIRSLADKKKATQVLVMAENLSGEAMRDILRQCEAASLQVKVLPTIGGMLHGKAQLQLRDVEINDLLRRDPVHLDSVAIKRQLKGKTVLVTGAGGSIGSEICRQVLEFEPKALVLVEQAENNLFFVERELRAGGSKASIRACVADILDAPRIRSLFETHRPDVVFHAAAHKHVPMMEANVGEAIKNNVLGTRTVADIAHRQGVGCFVLISTDKAVNPTSVMGVTKQLAERYVHALSQESETRFISVRFGNVLGSAGSVVPIFKEQIRNGGPVTVTDKRMERFFMTIPEASRLVLQAGTMGTGGEIYVLDMGEPVRIVELAEDLIRLSGYSLGQIGIEFTGIRPGEKLNEELYFQDEEMLETKHPKVRAAYHRPCQLSDVERDFAELTKNLDLPNDRLKQGLSELVPEYQPFQRSRQAEEQFSGP